MNTETTKKERQPFQVPARMRDDWYSLAEACEVLAVSRFTVAELVNKGVLTRDYYGKFCVIGKASVDAYLSRFSSPGR